MNKLLYAFALIVGFNFSSVVMAQEGTLEIEEIVVTVTKKSESTQDLALSIIAFDSDDVEARQIKDIQSLSQNIPGFVALVRQPPAHMSQHQTDTVLEMPPYLTWDFLM